LIAAAGFAIDDAALAWGSKVLKNGKFGENIYGALSTTVFFVQINI